MSIPVLATKLYIPPPPPRAVRRPRLVEQLTEGVHRKLTLISAPAGFGKTTVVREWVATSGTHVAWLSLDEGDSDPARFLTYLIAALRTIVPGIGESLLGALQSPQLPSNEAVLTPLLNEIAAIPYQVILVLDDYHAIDSKATVPGGGPEFPQPQPGASPGTGREGVDSALTFLLKHLPPQMHLVIATREDPQLPLPRLRGRGELTELRAADLRFTPSEAAGFLNEAMGLRLSAQDVAALERRTEGWIAGLQLAAILMQDHKDASGFIESFTGSHRFVMDYLVEEVLQHQPESV